MITLAGTLTIPGLSELKLMVRGDGTVAERFSVRFPVVIPVMVNVGDAKPTVAVTRTELVAEIRPVPAAVMVAAPTLIPFICGCAAGLVAPAGMMIVEGLIVTLVGSLLVSVMVEPPAGALLKRVTAMGTDCERVTVADVGKEICPEFETDTVVEAPV